MCYITGPALKSYILILVITSLFACSSSENETAQTSKIKISNLVGLWNSSEKHGEKTDVMYTRISSTGDIVEYDFDGDEVDQGLNCYQINSGKIIPIKDNIFTVTTDMHKGKIFEVELEMLDDGHALKIYFLKEHAVSSGASSARDVDIGSAGDKRQKAKAVSSQIWTRMRNSSVLANEPSCS